MAFYVSVGPRYILFRVGMIWTGVTGSLTYWWTNRRPRDPRSPVFAPCFSGWSSSR